MSFTATKVQIRKTCLFRDGV